MKIYSTLFNEDTFIRKKTYEDFVTKVENEGIELDESEIIDIIYWINESFSDNSFDVKSRSLSRRKVLLSIPRLLKELSLEELFTLKAFQVELLRLTSNIRETYNDLPLLDIHLNRKHNFND